MPPTHAPLHGACSEADYSTSEMLVNMGNLPLDEFYPAVSMVALMRIFRDQSLSHHHTVVVQAITFIFKSLGLKCVQFLPQVMPTFLNVIRVCDGAIREVVGMACEHQVPLIGLRDLEQNLLQRLQLAFSSNLVGKTPQKAREKCRLRRAS
ncbi:serine/threonine-protein kinase mTOR-like [Choloepus didactylus]|uniref:serine/threonine-protein kinase mTOR-like n=1 Tax=Choloepus didactylus TaxID=27675 RepID=UPI0018A09665|nr:serine/threonine-protein kinase mTOR-like [Choloepus didactylus]